MKTQNKIEIKETTEYFLLDSLVSLKFEIIIEKKDISNIFLIKLGELFAQHKSFNITYKELNSKIKCFLSGHSISGNFEMKIKQIKDSLLMGLKYTCLSFNYILVENLLPSLSMKDVFLAKKDASIKLEDSDKFYISGISKHINNNHHDECLFIKIGYLFYTEEMFNSGILAKFLIKFIDKNEIKFKPGKIYFSVNSEELSELIDNLEERNKTSLL